MSESVNRRISIYIDAVQAELQLKKLQEREQALVRTQAEIKQGSAAWKANALEIEKVRKQIDTLDGQLSGRLGPTLKQLKQEQNRLNAELSKMPIELRKGSEEFKKLQQVEKVIAGVGKETGRTATQWKQFTDQMKAGFVGVLGGNLATAVVGGTFNYVQQAISNAAKVSDQLADIRKTTGLTTQEITTLNSALGKIDTRTAISELRNMAIVAGQFGIPKEQILGFVKSVDMVNIALGDEFGGNAEAIAAEMSKLRNVFTDIKSDDIGMDVQHISNALNGLGAAGVATGPVIADFSNRIGGVGIQLGLTTGEVLGLSATLQELNVTTERGGTAVVKILQKMLTNTKQFAEVAGMPVKDFEKLLNEDLMGAFTKVMEGSKKLGTSSTLLAGIIDELELQGAGASEVFAKLGSNTGLLNERIKLSNELIVDNASITEEAAIKQDNLAGSIARLEKSWSKLTNSGGAQGFWQAMVDGAAASLDALGNFWNAVAGGAGLMNSHMADMEEQAIAIAEKRIQEEKAASAKVAMLRKAELEKMNNEELEQEAQKLRSKKKLALEAARISVSNGESAGFNDQKIIFNQYKQEIALIEEITKKKQAQKDTANQLTAAEKEDAEKEYQKLDSKLEAWRNFKEEVKRVSDEAAAAVASKDEEQIQKVSNKYNKLLAKAKDYYSELPQIATEYVAVVKQLNDAEYNDKIAILNKQIADADKAYNTDLANFLKSEKAKTDKLREETEARIQDEYRNLLGSANAGIISGQTDGSLSPEELVEKKKEAMLLETEAILENDRLTAGEKEQIWAQYYANVKALDDDLAQTQLRNAFEFANQIGSVMNSMAQISQNKATEKIAQEQRFTDRAKAENEKRKAQELAALEDRNAKGLFKNDEYTRAREAIEERYARSTQLLEDELARKKTSAAEEAAIRQKRSATFDAIISTAAAIISMLADPGGVAGVALSIGAGITGAAQIAAIQSTPLPQFYDGGTTLVRGAGNGKLYNARNIGTFKNGGKVASASYGIIGEEGSELVVPNWMYTHPAMFDTMKYLEYSISSGKLLANGGATTQPQFVSSNSGNDEIKQMIAANTAILGQVAQALNGLKARLNEPFITTMNYDLLEESMERISGIRSDNSIK